MKKFKFLLSLVVMASLAVLANGLTTSEVEAASVPTSSIEAWKFAGGWDDQSSYVENGVKVVVPGADTVGTADAWNRTVNIPNTSMPSLSIKDNEAVSIAFSVKLFDEDGNVISKSQNSDALDIKIKNRANDAQIAMVRIWTGSNPNGGDQNFHLYDTGWTDMNDGKWIKGTAKASSSFFLQISKENLIQSYVGGHDGLYTLGNEAFQTYAREALANVDEVYLEIGGENGFTNAVEFTILEINGESLANVDGNFDDKVAPKFNNAIVSSTLNVGEEYTIPTEAFDLFSTNITYSLSINGETIEGKTFTPTADGELNVTLNATDAAGNVATKDYVFEVVEEIAAPEITELPEITGRELKLYETLTFEKPVYNDATGNATTVLKIYQGEDTENPLVLSENENHEFTLRVLPSFTAGDYKFVYEITNAGGVTVAEAINVSYTLEAAYEATFITYNSSSSYADYVAEGIRVRGATNWVYTSFGTFDIAHGLDIKFVIPFGADNSDAFDLRLINVDDPNYRIMYRVWADGSSADRPTNVFISYDGAEYRDITETGWISRNVDGVANQYHMLYNVDETLLGERQGGIQRVDKAYEALLEFFSAAPSSNFELSFSRSSLNGGDYFEYIITEINGQKLASTNGVVNEVEDAYLSVDMLAEKVLINEELVISAYSKDLFQATELLLTVTKPDGTSSDVDLVNGSVAVLFDTLGTYILKVSTVGLNGNVVEKEITIECKSSIEDIELTAPTYEANYDIGTEITILAATYSANVVEKSIVVKYQDGSETVVSENDKYTFAKPGVYTIIYKALDDAEPTPNSKEVTVTINVPDETNPVINVEIVSEANVGDKVQPTITVTDDSEYDVTVTLTKPDGSVITLTGNYEFNADNAGAYTLKVLVEDIYGNASEVAKTITVAEVNNVEEPVKNGCFGGATLSLLSILALGMGAIILKKKKENE